MRMNRFVLDNNIWISYFITTQQQKIIDIISLYEINIFSCDVLVAEFNAVLHYDHIKKYRINIQKSIKQLKEITTHFLSPTRSKITSR